MPEGIDYEPNLAPTTVDPMLQTTETAKFLKPSANPNPVAFFRGSSDRTKYLFRYQQITTFFCEDNGRPIARLRPTGKSDLVEVMWWSHRDKWEQIGDFGPIVMSLDKALKYVVKDPMGIF